MTLSVQQLGGGDWTTLDQAFDDASASEQINIEGAWTADDTRNAICAVDCQVTTLGASRHPGYLSGSSWSHYRLVAGGDDTLLMNGDFTVVFDGLVVINNGTTSSGEACDFRPGTSDSVTIKNSLIHVSGDTTQQDCVYTGYFNVCGPVTLEQCILTGAYRGGINAQNGNSAITINVNSCVIYDCGHDDAGGVGGAGGIINFDHLTSTAVVFNVYNSVVVGNTTGTDCLDFWDGAGNATWNISYSMDSDNSIANVIDSGSNNYASYTARESSSGGNEVLFEDITTSPYDLRLIDDANNDAQDIHDPSGSEPIHGMSIPATDIIGTARPQNTDFDISAFEIVAGGAAIAPTSTLYGPLVGPLGGPV